MLHKNLIDSKKKKKKLRVPKTLEGNHQGYTTFMSETKHAIKRLTKTFLDLLVIKYFRYYLVNLESMLAMPIITESRVSKNSTMYLKSLSMD